MAKKEIRFGELVKNSGKPEIVTLWTDPQQDRAFMKAVKENRVLTVLQEPTSKRKDFARIGFHQEAHASYFVFPKPLPRDHTPRVIGIKYELAEQPSVADPVSLRALKPAAKPEEPAAAPRRKRFDIVVRRVATIETSVAVSAADDDEAKLQAIRSARSKPFDPAKAVMHNEIVSVQESGRWSRENRRTHSKKP